MKRKRPPLIRTLLRCLRLRCPVCGLSSIAARPFKIKDHCDACDALFMREEGFFVGAILINVVTTEVVILMVYLICLVLIGINYQTVLWVLFVSAMLFPLAFYHHSWSIWLGFDHLIETLPKKPGKESPPPHENDHWPEQIDS